jgi:hypothetical protein
MAIIVMVLSCQSEKKQWTVDAMAEQYVRLMLEIGQYDDNFVDAYFGPEEWQPVKDSASTLDSEKMLAKAEELIEQCQSIESKSDAGDDLFRLELIRKQLIAAKTILRMKQGESFTFNEEAKLLYDISPSQNALTYFDSLLTVLDKAIPGEGNLSDRFNEYAGQFALSKEVMDTVFRKAIDVARQRTKEHMVLPADEKFNLSYVTDKSWSGYNYYQGNNTSEILINTDFPIFIQRAVDLGCHEGYPGHHVMMTLMEQNLVIKKGWMEFTIYPLFSPLSFLAEGSANYGIDVVFPGEEKRQFEKDVLFPLAHLDTSLADQYFKILDIKAKLDFAGNEVGRMYLEGEITRETAGSMLQKYLLMAPLRAEKRVQFIENYRSYIINYNLGKQVVSDYIERLGGTADQPEKRWQILMDLLSHPMVPSKMIN